MNPIQHHPQSAQQKQSPQVVAHDHLTASIDHVEISVLAAKLYALEAANKAGIPKTIFRTENTSGWWHINPDSKLLSKAEVLVTILPAQYFH